MSRFNIDQELQQLLPNPDLQELVQQFGGYNKITPQAWAKYDAQLAATRDWLAAHHKVLVPSEPRRSVTIYPMENRADPAKVKMLWAEMFQKNGRRDYRGL